MDAAMARRIVPAAAALAGLLACDWFAGSDPDNGLPPATATGSSKRAAETAAAAAALTALDEGKA